VSWSQRSRERIWMLSKGKANGSVEGPYAGKKTHKMKPEELTAARAKRLGYGAGASFEYIRMRSTGRQNGFVERTLGVCEGAQLISAEHRYASDHQ
jgi:hypothetical protein